MGLDLGQHQLGDVLGELFQAAVFASPYLDFFEQSQRDIDGAGFAFLFRGEVIGGVALALLAMAARATAAPVDEDQAGGQVGRLGVQLFGPGLVLEVVVGGMVGGVYV